MPFAAPVPPNSRRLAHLLEASAGAQVGRHLPWRSLVFDALTAGLLMAMGWLLLRVFSPRADFDDELFVIMVNLPLVLRRRMPRAALGLVLAVGIAQMLLRVKIGLYDASLLFALYSAVGYTNRRFGLTSLAATGLAIVVGALTGWWVFVDRQFGSPSALLRVATSLGAAVLAAATWALGERLRSARLGVITLAERADQLEREREHQAQLAAAAERARIAREMHDVIAHGLSVMIVQADGAAYVVEQSPGTARLALEQISATGRESLAEMRNLLGLLRTGSAPGPGAIEEPISPGPQPDLAELEQLLDHARQAGAEVTAHTEGNLAGLPTMVSLTAYRVLQEALTNARKHGGHRVHLSIRAGADGLHITVRDEGADDGQPRLTQETGHGLVGMRERVSAVNGRLSTGPRPDGGFQVDAWLPLTADPAAISTPATTTREPT